ncbi:hypothetical protein A2U01_0045202, partial [Trifolium medium]|nr:hypothetical protein [Trifolium medium]
MSKEKNQDEESKETNEEDMIVIPSSPKDSYNKISFDKQPIGSDDYNL